MSSVERAFRGAAAAVAGLLAGSRSFAWRELDRRRRPRRLASPSVSQEKAGSRAEAGSIAAIVAAVALGLVFMGSTVANRIIFRLVLVPMGSFGHLLATTTNMVYLAVFFVAILYDGSRAGSGDAAVTTVIGGKAWNFALRGRSGLLLALSGVMQATVFTVMPLFASRLPGSMLPVMSQTSIPFSLILSGLLLGRRYDVLQEVGVILVLLGTAVCSYPKYVVSSMAQLADAHLPSFVFNMLGLLVAYFFNSASLVLKEKAIIQYEDENEGKKLSGKLVNLVSSLWQAAALFALWPLNFALLTPLAAKAYFIQAWSVVCQPSTAVLLLLYWGVNIFYVIMTVKAIRRLSSVAVLLIQAFSVPITALLFCFNLPLLPAEPFSFFFVGGLLVILTGVLTFNHRSLKIPQVKASK